MVPLKCIVILLPLLTTLASATPSADIPPVEIGLAPLESTDLPSGLSSDRARGIVLSIKNTSTDPIRLLWCDFFFQMAGAKWIGGWWLSESPISGKISQILANGGLEGTALPPGEKVEYKLVDKWMSEMEKMEYKFACLVSGPSATVSMVETPPVTVPTVIVDRSGVDRAVAGVSSALESLFTPSTPTVQADPVGLGVTVEHNPTGPVQVSRSSLLRESVAKWISSEQETAQPIVHVYRTGVVNNTLSPLRLVLLEIATKVDGKWLTGYLRSPIVSAREIARQGYLEEFGADDIPKIEKTEDNWIPPGARVVLPYQWHPPSQKETNTSAKWRAVLITESGDPVYAEGETPAGLPPVLVPPPSLP